MELLLIILFSIILLDLVYWLILFYDYKLEIRLDRETNKICGALLKPKSDKVKTHDPDFQRVDKSIFYKFCYFWYCYYFTITYFFLIRLIYLFNSPKYFYKIVIAIIIGFSLSYCNMSFIVEIVKLLLK